MSEIEDWALIARAQGGDMDAFQVLIVRYQRPVIHFCYRMLRSEQDAEDIAQEVFIRVYRYLKRLTPQAKFSTVLFGIARNLCLNFVRDMNRRGRGMGQPLDAQSALESNVRLPSQEVHLKEIEACIQAAMDTLSDDHRMVLFLRDVEGLDYEEIGRVMKCRKGTVKSRLARAREQLRQTLIQNGDDLL